MKNDEDRSKCVKEKQKYESSCLPSWVKYFERKKIFDEYKTKLEKEGHTEEGSTS
jgi:hypothetical protein